MARSKARPTEPPETVELSGLTPFEEPSLEPHGDYDEIEFADLDLRGATAPDAAFQGCRFERCGLDGAAMARSRVSDCLFADVHAASLDLADSAWRDSLVRGGRFGAITAGGATWTRVALRAARLNFVDLSGARLTNVDMTDCVVGELDLTEAAVESVRLDGSTIEDLTVEGATLSKLDLSKATIRRLRGVGSLRGAILSRDQLADLAPALAAHLGIEVREG